MFASICSYSITLSARASNAGRTVTPKALAVLRLITNSNVDGCFIGNVRGLDALEDFDDLLGHYLSVGDRWSVFSTRRQRPR
jgi:hypothetical protein